MVRREEYLLFDLVDVCELFNHPSSPRQRAFAVRALNFLADFSFHQTQRAILTRSSDSYRGIWVRFDQQALNELSLQDHNADPFVRDAALDARADRRIRVAWIESMAEQERLRLARLMRLLDL
jgi:hypothetical protein